jgi:hypothetical protein
MSHAVSDLSSPCCMSHAVSAEGELSYSDDTDLFPAPKRQRPLSEDWEGYKAWLRAGRPRLVQLLQQGWATTKKKPASRKQEQATTKKKPALREKKELWEEYDPALDKASKYWDVEVEGKRRRNLTSLSSVEDEARCASEDDPADEAFNPQTAVESSSESDNEAIAKKLVRPPFPHNPPSLT